MKTELITVDGRQYLARGWMNGISAPVGTILGPNSLDEYLTVVESEPNRVRLAHTRPDDYTRMSTNARSLTEYVFQVEARFKNARQHAAAGSVTNVRSQSLRSVRGRSHRR